MGKYAQITLFLCILIILILGLQLVGGKYQDNNFVPLLWIFLNSFLLLITGYAFEKGFKLLGGEKLKLKPSLLGTILLILYFIILITIILVQPFLEFTPTETLKNSFFITLPFQLLILLFYYLNSASIPINTNQEIKKILIIQPQKALVSGDKKILSKEKDIILKFVGNGKLENSFDSLLPILKENQSSYYDSALLLKSKYKKLKKDKADNVISDEYASIELSRITKGFLNLVREV